MQPIPGLISCVGGMCKAGRACIISLALRMDKTMQPPDFLSYMRYQSPSLGQPTRPGIVRKAFHSVSDSVSQLVVPLTWPIDCSCTQCMLPWQCVFCSAAANSLQTRRARVPSAQTKKKKPSQQSNFGRMAMLQLNNKPTKRPPYYTRACSIT